MKLKVGQCACTKNKRVYCHTKDGYRFTAKRCNVPGRKIQLNTITIYKSDGCGACATVIPVLRRLAQKKGVKVKIVDVDECGEKCDYIRYVPFVEVDDHRMNDLSKLATMLR